jgi:phosphoribosylanthranilate isomerase
MAQPFVKICGIRDVEMAHVAAAAGANAIGLVFYPPSPRAVSMDVAKKIVERLPPNVAAVALMVNATASEVKKIIAEVKPTILQFHGDEDAQFCQQFGLPYWKAIRVNPSSDLLNLGAQFSTAQRLLLDADKGEKGLFGGTGESFDYSLIPSTLGSSIILSGGLTPSNVAKAINTVKPWGVDVSSGVEVIKGVKDAKLIQQFMNEVSRADV